MIPVADDTTRRSQQPWGDPVPVRQLPDRGRAREPPAISRQAQLRLHAQLHTVEIVGVRALEHSDPHTDAIYFTKGDALCYVGISAPTSPTKGGALALAKIAASRL